MRINITYQTVDDDFLYDELVKFGDRNKVDPYAIMSAKTISALAVKSDLVKLDDGTFEFKGYKILKNNNLDYGDVDIR